MMLFNKKRQDPAADRLATLLSQVKTPVKTRQEWDRLVNDLFVRLDEQLPAAPARARQVFAMPKISVAWACAAALCLSVTGIGMSIAFLKSASSVSTASLVSLQGQVAVKKAGGAGFDTLSSLETQVFGKRLSQGAVVRTLAHGTSIIRLDKGSVIELYPNSQLTIKAATASQQVCMLSAGRVLAKVQKRQSGQRFEVRTPLATCSVVGTVFSVDASGATGTTLSVYQGKVRLVPARGVKAGETLVATGNQVTLTSDGTSAARQLSEATTPIKDISMLGMLVDEGADGVLDIGSKPEGAKVMINGVMVGTTPLLVKKPRGAYRLSLYSDGYRSWETVTAIGIDRVTAVTAVMSRLPDAVTPAIIQVKRPAPVSPAQRRTLGEAQLRLFPDYVEALVDMGSGEYQRAIELFDSLSGSGLIDLRARTVIMEKVNACYARLGNFEHAGEALEEKYFKAESPIDKGSLLWEIATMRANCLGDYQGAEMALVEFLILQPNGMRAHSAYSRLAEIQYYLNKFESAAKTYQRHIKIFPDDPDIDKSMFNLACILAEDFNECEKAAGWYSRLLDSFHASKYRAAAFFHRGECELRTGKLQEAQRDFKAYLSLSPDGIWRQTCVAYLKNRKES